MNRHRREYNKWQTRGNQKIDSAGVLGDAVLGQAARELSLQRSED